LAEIASEDRRMDFRQDARSACDNLGCADKVDRVKKLRPGLGARA